MFVNIDIAIVIMFLVINLSLGVWVGRGIRTIKEYAIGDRNFNTATIAATLIATWISGSYFTVCIAQTYREGIWFLPAAIGNVISTLMIGYIFAPRMKEFFGSLSVAETMGNLFGKHIRFITAIACVLQAIAMTALQIKVFSTVFSYFFNFPTLYATCISSFVVIFYSTWGGIRAVTFTDVIQFCTFGVFIPLFSLFIVKTFGDIEAISVAIHTNPLLDFTQLINLDNPKFWPSFVIFLWFLIPNFNSTTFQRMLMANSTKQMSQSFTLASLGYGMIVILTCGIGVIVLSFNQSLESNNIVMYILDNYAFPGLKGITLIGIIAMVMSTADSWINTGAVIFAHDLCKPLGIKFKDELFLSRMFSIIVGVGSLSLVLFYENVFKLFVLQSSFYMPIVTVPLTLAIFGFRSSSKVVMLGMVGGALCVILWRIYIQPSTDIDGIVPGMAANLITILLSHYLLGAKGGWVGIKDDSDLQKTRIDRKKISFDFAKYWDNLSYTNILQYCTKHLPKDNMSYVYFAFSLVITTAIMMLLLDTHIYQENATLVNLLQGAVFLISASFICHKIWPNSLREKYMGLIWYLSIYFGLVVVSSLLVLISKFSQVSVVILILDLSVVSILVSWRVTLLMIISGMWLALFGYEYYVGASPEVITEFHDMKLNIFYILLAMGGLLFSFFKPQQERKELIEETNAHLKDAMNFKDAELQKAVDLKFEFLRNMEHESHTPITGITTMGQVLWENYDNLSDKQIRQGLEDIAKSSVRLSTLVNNLVDLSKLSRSTYQLQIHKINLSNLLNDRLDICKKVHLENKNLEFVSNISPNITVACDEYYISSVIDNLITNAIQYSSEGKIVIDLTKTNAEVKFSITDEGKGIPSSELHDIFGAFVVSSKTHTPSGGRGVGLALCKKSIEMHNGKIWAESNGKKGACFTFVIPVK